MNYSYFLLMSNTYEIYKFTGVNVIPIFYFQHFFHFFFLLFYFILIQSLKGSEGYNNLSCSSLVRHRLPNVTFLNLVR